MSLPGVTPSFEQHHISCISSFSFYGRLLTPLSIQQAERLVQWNSFMQAIDMFSDDFMEDERDNDIKQERESL